MLKMQLSFKKDERKLFASIWLNGYRKCSARIYLGESSYCSTLKEEFCISREDELNG